MKSIMQSPKIAVIMGSASDFPIMEEAVFILNYFKVECVAEVVSAHRTPEHMVQFAQQAKDRGLKIIIAGAGGAAHLPGMVASLTPLPVIGVPIKSSNSIDGWDSVLSILQMPGGIPVATVALNGARNAGLLAVRMLAMEDEALSEKLVTYSEELKEKVMDSAKTINKEK